MSVCGHQHVLKPKWPILGVQMPSIILLLYDKLRIIKWGLSLVMLFTFALSFTYCLLFFCFRSLYLLLTYVPLLFNVTPLLHLPTHHNWTSFLFISIICFICFILLLLLAFPLATLFCNFLITYNMFIKKSEHFILCT
jgi:hypothetical protein